jgi:hypothetical protein
MNLMLMEIFAHEQEVADIEMEPQQPDSRNDSQFQYYFKKLASIHLHLKVLVILTVDIIEGDGSRDAFHVMLGSLTRV